MKHPLSVTKLLPRHVIYRLMNVHAFFHRGAIKRAERALSASSTGKKLTYNHLCEMNSKYPPHPDYGYDPITLSHRGFERAEQIRRQDRKAHYYLELGAWDGMVSYWLQECTTPSVSATAVDIRDEGLEDMARETIQFYKVDASSLPFADDTFDFTFSYDAMEHFAEPEKALAEAMRVTRHGGHVFLLFGPLYNSALGLHGYRSINVPYCQHLFDRDTLDAYVHNHYVDLINYKQLNGYSLSAFMRMFDQYNVARCRQIKDARFVELIERYPQCFDGTDINEYLVSHMEVLLRKE